MGNLTFKYKRPLQLKRLATLFFHLGLLISSLVLNSAPAWSNQSLCSEVFLEREGSGRLHLSDSQRETADTLIPQILQYVKNIEFEYNINLYNLGQRPTYPANYERITDWQADLLKQIAQIDGETRRYIKSQLPQRLLSLESATGYYRNSESLLAFALRDQEYMEKRIQYFLSGTGQYIPLEFRNLLSLSTSMSDQELLDIYGPLLNDYFQQNKMASKGSDALPSKRASDILISFISLRAFNKTTGTTLEKYKSYINRVKSLTEFRKTATSLNKTSNNPQINSAEKNIEFLTRIHKNLITRIDSGEIHPSTQVILWGSFLNGRATERSDIDNGEFYQEAEMRSWVRNARKFPSIINELTKDIFLANCQSEQHPLEFESPDELIGFGKRTGGMVFIINKNGIQLVAEDKSIPLK